MYVSNIDIFTILRKSNRISIMIVIINLFYRQLKIKRNGQEPKKVKHDESWARF
jgi:hypothetical protein